MGGKRLSDCIAALCDESVTTSTITEGTTLTSEMINEAMKSLMISPSITKDSLCDMHYERMSKQEAMDREYMMRHSEVQYDYRTMSYLPYGYDEGTDDRSKGLARENDMLKAELHAAKQAAEAKKAERIKSRDNLIAHYYSMRLATP